jgi:beta-1,4-mannooligosaccharide/beta-1,4-mannosyl-N-acetylglucosamine phosphorylase
MSKVKIIGDSIPNIPWEDKPAGCTEVTWRHSGNPIIKRNPTKNCSRIFNSALVPYGDGFAGVFRADHRDGMPKIQNGYSKDGLNWEIEDKPIQWFDESGAPYQPEYAYDPRVVKIDDTYYIMWCTGFGGAPTIGMGKTKDFKNFTRLENAFIPYNRNGVLFPRKINGNYMLLSRPSDTGHTPFGDIFLSESPDMIYWGKHRRVMTKGGGWWQGTKIGAGPIPIETSEGWLMIYHGVCNTCNGFVYSTGAALLDIDQPSKVLYRCRDFILTPEEPYETTGFVDNVVFPCAALCDADTGRIAMYCGAADTYVSVAYAQMDELVEYIKENSELHPGDGEVFR